jgi:hypothetical protein
MRTLVDRLDAVGSALVREEYWIPLALSAMIVAAAGWGLRRSPVSWPRILAVVVVAVAGIWFAAHSSAWLLADRVWTSVIVVTVVSVLAFAQRIHNLSPSTRTVLAAAGFVFLAFGILVSDVPGRDEWRSFMADRALLSGFISSALLIGLGYLAVDAQVEGQRARRAARLRTHAFDQVSDYWRPIVGMNDFAVSDPESKCRGLGLVGGSAFSRSNTELNLVSAIERCAAEVAVWVAILGSLDDDDPEHIVQLWADFRRSLLGVIQAPVEVDYGIRPRTNEMVKAGLTLEEIRYRTARGDRRTRLKVSAAFRRTKPEPSDLDARKDASPYFVTSMLLPIPSTRVVGTISGETMFPWFGYDTQTPDGDYEWAKAFGTFAEGAGWWRMADKHLSGHRAPSSRCVLQEPHRNDLPVLVNRDIAASQALRDLREDAAETWKVAAQRVRPV